jgi:TolB-like protein
MSLFAELKRRKVFRAAIAYLVVAWVVVEVASTVAPNLNLPEWTPRMVTLLVMLGFPLALVLAWIFEVTPEGVKVTENHGGNRGFYAVAAVIAVAAIGWFLYSGSPGEDARLPDADEGPSIAVLPFVNMSEDAGNEYFADGISEELLNILAGIDGLKVASRTSAFSFKDTNTPIPEIAELLGVRHVLEGSVRKQGNRVRITAQLIEAGDDAHLWSESYDRTLDDIFKVQEEIAQAITLALGDVLGTRRVTVQASTGDLEAYERFLSGRARFHQRSGLDEAIADLGYATEHDPGFAEAWIYLAAAHHVAPGYPSDRNLPYEAMEQAARAALARAKALLPDNPLVLAVEASMEARSGNPVAALALFERASAMRSHDSTPTMWHGLLLLRAGYIVEAIAVLERAHRMDPRVGINSGYLGLSYLAAGRDAEAEEQIRLAHANGWSIAARLYVIALAARGERARAVDFLQSVVAEEDLASPAGIAFRDAIADPGQAAPLVAMIEGPDGFDEVLLGLEREQRFLTAAEALSRRPEGKQAWWLRMVWQPSSVGIREDPRFFGIARELGLVELWETRGYPPGCSRVVAPEGDRLDCPGMRP